MDAERTQVALHWFGMRQGETGDAMLPRDIHPMGYSGWPHEVHFVREAQIGDGRWDPPDSRDDRAFRTHGLVPLCHQAARAVQHPYPANLETHPGGDQEDDEGERSGLQP